MSFLAFCVSAMKKWGWSQGRQPRSARRFWVRASPPFFMLLLFLLGLVRQSSLALAQFGRTFVDLDQIGFDRTSLLLSCLSSCARETKTHRTDIGLGMFDAEAERFCGAPDPARKHAKRHREHANDREQTDSDHVFPFQEWRADDYAARIFRPYNTVKIGATSPARRFCLFALLAGVAVAARARKERQTRSQPDRGTAAQVSRPEP